MVTKFTSAVQTGPETHPDSYIMGTGLFPGIKRPGLGVEHPPCNRTDKKWGRFITGIWSLFFLGVKIVYWWTGQIYVKLVN